MSVAAPGREVAFRSVPLEDGALLVQAVLAVVPHAAAPAPERERPDRERRSRGDAAEQLRELVRQRDAGLLTPEEFAAERARIVARL
jgi:cytochrome c-type biogenesis protein CcmH/NrfG